MASPSPLPEVYHLPVFAVAAARAASQPKPSPIMMITLTPFPAAKAEGVPKGETVKNRT